MKKRGISGVITAVILILLVLVMTAVIWVVVRNLVTEELDDATAGISRVDLEVKKVTINPQVNTLSVRVKRNIGKGNLSKVKFILSDGKNTESQDIPTTMGELDEQTFNVSYSL
ncbi:MAG: archaellin/type IV pilin N-terminal domain-containing protein, partial [Candidatus Nanoarchaeia archaeon]